ncbi:hypothetical protein B7R54_04550 [Subtercola boreus]|uniref:Potassium-transporting ATPase subunit F n=1 Tax=Subtercola boreus TaxID=120213 RepID=A0A3E0VF61_9MICO|nr:hypothetical protein B7R54_04550 [Subtercola boreus]
MKTANTPHPGVSNRVLYQSPTHHLPDGVSRARRLLRCRHHRVVRDRCPRGQGGRETVIVFSILAAALAIAALGYLVYALVKPERF